MSEIIWVVCRHCGKPDLFTTFLGEEDAKL